MSIALVPAYGRVYNDKNEMLQDWVNGSDFKIYCGQYCSIRDKDKLIEEYNSIDIFWNYYRGGTQVYMIFQ
jgi:hypothetical protein